LQWGPGIEFLERRRTLALHRAIVYNLSAGG